MPHIDSTPASGGVSTYECLDCGETVTARTHPGSCPDCDSTLRNTAEPVE